MTARPVHSMVCIRGLPRLAVADVNLATGHLRVAVRMLVRTPPQSMAVRETAANMAARSCTGRRHSGVADLT